MRNRTGAQAIQGWQWRGGEWGEGGSGGVESGGVEEWGRGRGQSIDVLRGGLLRLGRLEPLEQEEPVVSSDLSTPGDAMLLYYKLAKPSSPGLG